MIKLLKSLLKSRYSGNGTRQMGLLVESASLFDNGNWTLTMRNNGSTAIADGIIAQVKSADYESQDPHTP